MASPGNASLPLEASLTIAYASATGTAADYATRFASLACRRRLPVGYVGPLDGLPLPALARCRGLVLFISTTGDGDMPPNGAVTWRSLLRRDLPPTTLASIGGVTLFGLGDSGYPKFAAAARKAWTRMTGQLGARVAWPRGLGDENSPQGLAGDFTAWLRGPPGADGAASSSGERNEGIWAALASLFSPQVQAAAALPPLPPALTRRRYRVWALGGGGGGGGERGSVSASVLGNEGGASSAHAFCACGLTTFNAVYNAPLVVPLGRALSELQARCSCGHGRAEEGVQSDGASASSELQHSGDSKPAANDSLRTAELLKRFPFLPLPPAATAAAAAASSAPGTLASSAEAPHPCGSAIFPARLLSNTRATAEDWTQDVRILRLCVPIPPALREEEGGSDGPSPPLIQAGDVALVWPANTTASPINAPVFCDSNKTGSAPPARPCPVAALAARLGLPPAALDAPLCIAASDDLEEAAPSSSEAVDESAKPFTPSPLDAPPASPPDSLLVTLTTPRLLLAHWTAATRGAVSRAFFEQAAFYTDASAEAGPEQAEKLLELSSPAASDLFHAYAVAERRGVPDVLGDFTATSPPLSLLLETLPPLYPRAYSLAGIEPAAGGEPGVVVELCVAVAAAKTRYGQRRVGLASGWLASLAPGAIVPLSFKRGAFNPRGELWSTLLPSSSSSSSSSLPPPPPVVMVGPGTGIAPMMAVLRTAAASPSSSSPPLWLFTGFRHRAKDWLYGAEAVAAAGGAATTGGEHDGAGSAAAVTDTGNALTIVSSSSSTATSSPLCRYGVAFSRDDAAGRRLYVQGLLERAGGALATALAAGGRLWIAGSAKGMPSDVQAVVSDVLTRCVAAAAAAVAEGTPSSTSGGPVDAAAGAAIAAATLTAAELAALRAACASAPASSALPPPALAATAAARFLAAAAREGRVVVEAWA